VSVAVATRSRRRAPGRALALARRGPVDAVPALALLAALVVVGALVNPSFASAFNVSNVLTQVTPLALVAIGQTFVVGSRGLDLSVGSTVSLVAVVAASLFGPLGVAGGLAAAVAAGLLVGLVNGLAVARGLEPFLVTLASLSVVQGVAFLILETPGGQVPDAVTGIAGYWGGTFPRALPLVLVVALAAGLLLRRTRAGTHLLAVGGDREVARLNGVRVRPTLVWPYVLSAGCAVLAGLFLVARTRTGDPLIGQSLPLDSLAAVVLGGTALAGGRVTLVGSLAGALALGVLSNLLNFAGVSDYWQLPVKGAILVAAVLLPGVVAAGVERRRRARLAREVTPR
jgi:ribose transport system permease protein